MPKDQNGSRYRHQVSMITIAPSKAFPEPPKECNKDDQTKEGDKIVEHAHAPLAFEKGEQDTPDELLEVNLGSNEEPRLHLLVGICPPKIKI